MSEAGPDKPKLFIIYSKQRSGTHFLGSLLNSHPSMHSLGEVLHPNARRSFLPAGEPKPKSTAACEEAWDAFVERHHQDLNRPAFLGPIIMYNHRNRLPKPLCDKLFSESKILHLVRENLLRRYISNELNKTKSGSAHSRDSEGPLRTVALQPETVVAKLKQAERELERERGFAATLDSIEMSYEALNEDKRSELSRVCEFFNVPMIEMKTQLKRTNPYPLEDIIENYNEISDRLRAAGFGNFLEE